MRALIKTASDNDALCLMLFVHAGSIYDPPRIRGIAHMLEHLMFTTKKNKSESKLFEEMSKTGAQFNAYTSFDATVYFISGNSANWKALIDIFYTIVMDELDFSEEEYQREMSVVLEERSMRSNDTIWQVLGMFLKGTDYDKDPAGTVESIKNITIADLKAYHAKYYKDSYMVACIPKNVEEEASAMISRRFGKSVDGCFERPKLKRNLMQIRGSEDKVTFVSADEGDILSKLGIKTDKNPETNHFVNLFFASVPYESTQVALVDFWTHMLAGLGGIMYKNLRQTYGYTYGVQCSNTSLLDVGYYQIQFQSVHKNLTEVMDVFCKDLLELRNEPIAKDHFKASKQGFIEARKYELNDSYNRCTQLGQAAFYDGLIFATAEEYVEFLDRVITYEAVLEMGQELFTFGNSKLIISSSDPQDDETKAHIVNKFMEIIVVKKEQE